MTKKLKNLSLRLTCVRQLSRQREPSVYGWQITGARLAGQQKKTFMLNRHIRKIKAAVAKYATAACNKLVFICQIPPQDSRLR